MTNTLLSPSPIAAPVRRRYLTGNGHAQPTATVSAAFGRQNRKSLSATSPPDRTQADQNHRSRRSLSRRPVRNRPISQASR